MRDYRSQKGFSIIEIIVGSAIITVTGLAIILGVISYTEVSAKNSINIQVALLFEETSEAIQFLRDTSWSENIGNKNLNQDYFLNWDGTNYSLTTTPNVYNESYIRTVQFQQVERDSNDNITNSGTNDNRTRLVKIIVSKPYKNSTTTKETEMLIHDTYEN